MEKVVNERWREESFFERVENKASYRAEREECWYDGEKGK
jgi:hypothetical protein